MIPSLSCSINFPPHSLLDYVLRVTHLVSAVLKTNKQNFLLISHFLPCSSALWSKILKRSFKDSFSTSCSYSPWRPFQSMFYPYHATESALVKVTIDHHVAIQWSIIRPYLLDRSSAFLSIDHSYLLKTLSSLSLGIIISKEFIFYLTHNTYPLSFLGPFSF